MGVYDHLMRPSMGHKLQVDLRHSMQRYHHDKQLLHRSLSQLRLHDHHLHTTTTTSSSSPSNQPPLKHWGDPHSAFGKAPEVAAHKARLAQLRQENSRLSNHSGTEATVSNSNNNSNNNSNHLLPPIAHSRQGDSLHTAVESSPSRPGEQAPDNRDTAHRDTAHGDTAHKPTKPTTARKRERGNRRFQKKATGGRKARDRGPPSAAVKLPTIHSARERRSVWDSGRQHLQVPPGPSTHLERNLVDEECRTFSHQSVPIPPISDTRRTEVQRPPATQRQAKADAVGTGAKVQFGRHHHRAPPVPGHQREKTMPGKAAAQGTAQGTAAERSLPRQASMDQLPQKAKDGMPPPTTTTQQPPLPPRQPSAAGHWLNKPTVDHFPKDTPRLPELDVASTDNEEEEEEESGGERVTEPRDREQVQRISLPAVPQPGKASSLQPQTSQQLVPPLRLPRGMTPSAKSTLTMQSGATGMSRMSQDTQGWKGAYVASENPLQKARMLREILHATRQRMQDNEEDLRLSGWSTQGEEDGGGVGGGEVMLLHREATHAGSGANTSRSSMPHGEKPLKLPHLHHHHHQKRGAHKASQEARLHRYLSRLSQRRRAGEGQGQGSSRLSQRRRAGEGAGAGKQQRHPTTHPPYRWRPCPSGR